LFFAEHLWLVAAIMGENGSRQIAWLPRKRRIVFSHEVARDRSRAAQAHGSSERKKGLAAQAATDVIGHG